PAQRQRGANENFIWRLGSMSHPAPQQEQKPRHKRHPTRQECHVCGVGAYHVSPPFATNLRGAAPAFHIAIVPWSRKVDCAQEPAISQQTSAVHEAYALLFVLD